MKIIYGLSQYINGDEKGNLRKGIKSTESLMNALNKLNLPEGFIIIMDEEQDLTIEDKRIFVPLDWKWFLSND